MLEEYFPILLQIAIAAGFAGATLVASVLFGKSAVRSTIKDSAYECGMLPLSAGQPRFSVKFYLVAMLFVLFDIEVVFLYPWAIIFKDFLATYGGGIILTAFSFVLILLAAYGYAWKKGALQWKI